MIVAGEEARTISEKAGQSTSANAEATDDTKYRDGKALVFINLHVKVNT